MTINTPPPPDGIQPMGVPPPRIYICKQKSWWVRLRNRLLGVPIQPVYAGGWMFRGETIRPWRLKKDALRGRDFSGLRFSISKEQVSTIWNEQQVNLKLICYYGGSSLSRPMLGIRHDRDDSISIGCLRFSKADLNTILEWAGE